MYQDLLIPGFEEEGAVFARELRPLGCGDDPPAV
jgi:hypothetical protein